MAYKPIKFNLIIDKKDINLSKKEILFFLYLRIGRG